MPPSKEPVGCKSLQELIEEVGIYPAPAYQFVQEALGYTVEKMHGRLPDPQTCRHVSGQQLCEGAREYALKQWGLLAPTVLRRWNITGTLDLGRIVFALIDIGQMQRTQDDTINDFRNVYDFKSAFDAYAITVGS